MGTNTGIYIDIHSSMVIAPFQQDVQNLNMLKWLIFTTISVRLVSELSIVELYIISCVSIFLFILTYRIIMNTIPTSDVPNTHSYVNACHKYWKKHINVQVQCCDYCSSHHRIRHVFNNITAREPQGKGIWTGFAAAGYNTTEGW